MPSAMFKMPPLEWVRAFEAAARLGSFTAAAQELGLTQSAVSQRIAQLETHLGARLFLRQPRAISLTVEGEAWLPHVRTALGGLQDSSEALFGRGRRQITISASATVIEQWLVPRLSGLSDLARGQLSLQTMVVGAHDAPIDDLIRIRYGAGDWSHAFKHPLYKEKSAPMAAPSLASRSDHWTSWPRIICAGPRPGWQAWAARFGIATTPLAHLKLDTFHAALSAALAGQGVIMGSVPLCAAALASGALVQLGSEVLDHHETYWALAGAQAMSQAEWQKFCAVLA